MEKRCAQTRRFLVGWEKIHDSLLASSLKIWKATPNEDRKALFWRGMIHLTSAAYSLLDTMSEHRAYRCRHLDSDVKEHSRISYFNTKINPPTPRMANFSLFISNGSFKGFWRCLMLAKIELTTWTTSS